MFRHAEKNQFCSLKVGSLWIKSPPDFQLCRNLIHTMHACPCVCIHITCTNRGRAFKCVLFLQLKTIQGWVFVVLHHLLWEISNSLAALLGSCLLFQNFMIKVVLEFLTAAIRKMGLLSLRHFTSSPARRQRIPALQFSQRNIKFDPVSIHWRPALLMPLPRA